MKLVSNLVMGLNRAVLAEGLVFAESLGLNLEATLQVLTESMAYSRTMDTKDQKMIRIRESDGPDWRPGGRHPRGRRPITIMLHADNFRPCWWHARDYGFVAANPFGRAAFKAGPPSKIIVSPEKPLCLRFGLLIHSSATKEELDLPGVYRNCVAMPSHVVVRKPPAGRGFMARRSWDTGYPIATVNAAGKIVVCYWIKTMNQDEPNYIGATIWDARSADTGLSGRE
jgi:hypothetical protein